METKEIKFCVATLRHEAELHQIQLFDCLKQARISSWSCGAKWLFGGHTKWGTDRHTNKQTHRGGYKDAPQLKCPLM